VPRRIQLKRTKGWRMPAGAVKVDRTTRWGNPFHQDACGSVERAVACHRAWLLGDAAALKRLGCPPPPRGAERPSLEEIRRELRGKDLACWCKPGTPCHGDLLVELANG
jgi:hypothetical protein